MARAYAPVAVVLLVAVTVMAAAGVLALVPSLPGEPPERRGVTAEATADGTVSLTLVSGPAVDPDPLDVRVEVDGNALARQPPVPFFSASGFYSGPTGAFNAASDDDWGVGETVTFQIAPTNDPTVVAGKSGARRTQGAGTAPRRRRGDRPSPTEELGGVGVSPRRGPAPARP